ncbi:MAG TPA: hypothetical protein VGD01_11785 [Candidatus Elarobacter sp.]|jgi:hypothetical protein
MSKAIARMSHFSLDDPDLLRKFKKAAKKAGQQSLKSKRSARATLLREGFITKSGRLTKNYSR